MRTLLSLMGQITRESRNYIQKNENLNTTYEKIWDAGKAGLRGKLIVTNIYTKKKNISQINNLNLHLKE